jgi:hypothetical protein
MGMIPQAFKRPEPGKTQCGGSEVPLLAARESDSGHAGKFLLANSYKVIL